MRLLLDENVSPSIVRPLSETGHDAYHVRDRGLMGQPDHVIWRHAVEEDRLMVTINARDFVRLAKREELHGGLVTFPSGSPPHEQPEADRLLGRDPMNRWLHIGDDGEIRSRDLPETSRPL